MKSTDTQYTMYHDFINKLNVYNPKLYQIIANTTSHIPSQVR